MASAPKKPRPINLALQGGGAHGAYTWGVLDRLLEEKSLVIEGISGTSAGAMNGAVLVNGYAKGGVDGAKEALENFWWRIAQIGIFSPIRQTPMEKIFNGWDMDASPSYILYDLTSRLASPYLLNPLNINPMRQVLSEQLDMNILHGHKAIKLFVAATSVRTGQARVFHCRELTVDMLLASACLPFMYQAIDIEGDAYWDGGYTSNPALWPLYHCETRDILLVQINPFGRNGVPKKASEILDRMSEIDFNSGLLAELRAIRFVSRLINDGVLSGKEYKDLRMHLIAAPEEIKQLGASSKLNADWDFFLYLKELGRKTADKCLEHHGDMIGVRSSFDMDEVLDFKRQPAPEV